MTTGVEMAGVHTPRSPGWPLPKLVPSDDAIMAVAKAKAKANLHAIVNSKEKTLLDNTIVPIVHQSRATTIHPANAKKLYAGFPLPSAVTAIAKAAEKAKPAAATAIDNEKEIANYPAAATNKKKKKTKTKTTIHHDLIVNEKKSAAATTTKKRKRKRSGWHWLLASDGMPSVVTDPARTITACRYSPSNNPRDQTSLRCAEHAHAPGISFDLSLSLSSSGEEICTPPNPKKSKKTKTKPKTEPAKVRRAAQQQQQSTGTNTIDDPRTSIPPPAVVETPTRPPDTSIPQAATKNGRVVASTIGTTTVFRKIVNHTESPYRGFLLRAEYYNTLNLRTYLVNEPLDLIQQRQPLSCAKYIREYVSEPRRGPRPLNDWAVATIDRHERLPSQKEDDPGEDEDETNYSSKSKAARRIPATRAAAIQTPPPAPLPSATATTTSSQQQAGEATTETQKPATKTTSTTTQTTKVIPRRGNKQKQRRGISSTTTKKPPTQQQRRVRTLKSSKPSNRRIRINVSKIKNNNTPPKKKNIDLSIRVRCVDRARGFWTIVDGDGSTTTTTQRRKIPPPLFFDRMDDEGYRTDTDLPKSSSSPSTSRGGTISRLPTKKRMLPTSKTRPSNRSSGGGSDAKNAAAATKTKPPPATNGKPSPTTTTKPKPSSTTPTVPLRKIVDHTWEDDGDLSLKVRFIEKASRGSSATAVMNLWMPFEQLQIEEPLMCAKYIREYVTEPRRGDRPLNDWAERTIRYYEKLVARGGTTLLPEDPSPVAPQLSSLSASAAAGKDDEEEEEQQQGTDKSRKTPPSISLDDSDSEESDSDTDSDSDSEDSEESNFRAVRFGKFLGVPRGKPAGRSQRRITATTTTATTTAKPRVSPDETTDEEEEPETTEAETEELSPSAAALRSKNSSSTWYWLLSPDRSPAATATTSEEPAEAQPPEKSIAGDEEKEERSLCVLSDNDEYVTNLITEGLVETEDDMDDEAWTEDEAEITTYHHHHNTKNDGWSFKLSPDGHWQQKLRAAGKTVTPAAASQHHHDDGANAGGPDHHPHPRRLSNVFGNINTGTGDDKEDEDEDEDEDNSAASSSGTNSEFVNDGEDDGKNVNGSHHLYWLKMYERLVAYKAKHGTTKVPYQYEGDPCLATWVFFQRKRRPPGDRVDLLNDIGFVW